jgi:hypothetical protein
MTDKARYTLAAALVLGGLFAWMVDRQAQGPTPAPAPGDAFSLRGKFIGPTAASDAAILAAFAEELASEIEHDSMQAEPFYKSGVAFDELRTRARLLRCRGESIGERQPRVRDAIQQYLEKAVGTSGGPGTPEQRTAWAVAYREIGRAAGEATR